MPFNIIEPKNSHLIFSDNSYKDLQDKFFGKFSLYTSSLENFFLNAFESISALYLIKSSLVFRLSS